MRLERVSRGSAAWLVAVSDLAALMMLEPEFSQMGRRRVPRAWRALRGWKKLTPTVTRKPLPWPFWCGIALVMGKHRATMAVFVLMCVSGYF